MTATIRDVARQAGTSTATVSHVLNSTGRITDKTRRRVLTAIKTLKYHPNLHARNLALGTSRTLGIIVSDIENPFFPAVVRAFEIRAQRRGYDVIASNTNYDPRLMKRAAERMLEQKVRGVRMKPRPTAVIAMNDLTAVGVIKALHQVGLRVPQHVSVVGFDRTQLAQCFIPTLTAVDMHADRLGQTAADALHELCTATNGEGR